MDCRTARFLLDFSRPLTKELEETEAEALQNHLADCADCGALAQAERTADHHIGLAMRAVPVPAGLRDRLLMRLDAERRPRDRRRWLWRMAGLAAAACLVLGVWGFVGWRNRLARIDVDDLGGSMIVEWSNPLPDGVERFCQNHGVYTVAPTDFRYALLKYYALVDVQGKRVPLLLFVQGQHQARVYILSDKQFDLEDALSKQQNAGSGYRYEVRRSPRDGHFAYLIVYTGDSLEPFLARGRS
ncbi:MAG TPA: hypothetical protein VG013_26395 [Gemmataceae bacterium]|jgi:hypothetical protein|nr:hypothetical protein [Gemmataceae bacterium]